MFMISLALIIIAALASIIISSYLELGWLIPVLGVIVIISSIYGMFLLKEKH